MVYVEFVLLPSPDSYRDCVFRERLPLFLTPACRSCFSAGRESTEATEKVSSQLFVPKVLCLGTTRTGAVGSKSDTTHINTKHQRFFRQYIARVIVVKLMRDAAPFDTLIIRSFF